MKMKITVLIIPLMSTCQNFNSRKICPPTEDERKTFFETINASEDKPAILKVTPPYSKQFIPKFCKTSLPPPISQLYEQEALGMDYLSLIGKCEEAARKVRYSNCCTCMTGHTA